MATWKHCIWIVFWTCLSIGFFSVSQGVAQDSLGDPQAVPETTSISVEKSVNTKKPVSFWEEFLSNPLWLMMAMFLVFYVGVLLPSQRSTRRQQKEHADLIANLRKNDRVVTSFGVHGVVVSTHPDTGTVTIRLDESSNAKMTVNRDTIRVVKKD